MPIERFFALLHFEQRGKLDQLGFEIQLEPIMFTIKLVEIKNFKHLHLFEIVATLAWLSIAYS